MELVGSVPTTLIPDVMKTCLPSGQAVAIFSERRVNSSCLFLDSIHAGNLANSLAASTGIFVECGHVGS